MAVTATVLLLLLAGAVAAAAEGEEATAESGQRAPESTAPDIRALEIRTDVRYRYAKTEVFSWIANPANESQEVTFRTVLPEAAFISGLAITQNGVVSHARVEGRQQAREQYRAAVQAGQTAARAEESARDARLFEVALNVAARSKATFNLTYEQLLPRERGRYRLRHMLDPGQVVEQLLVEVRIYDSVPLSLVRAASLRAMDNEVDPSAEGPDEPLATVERPAPEEAVVRWRPDSVAQRSLGDSGSGLHGLLEIQYDVEHGTNSSELVVGDGGYFVHFFAPPESELPLLPKHVVFVLDTSGSMYNTKIQQLKEAMTAILRELRSNDTFSIVLFSSGASVWSPARGLVEYRSPGRLPEDAVVPTSFVTEALAAVNATIASGGTYMWDGLQAAFALVRAGRSAGADRLPLLFFLTDGEPNGPHSSLEELKRAVAEAQQGAGVAPLYSLAFGAGADFAFLKQLSLKGKGFARRVYEAADAALQMRNLYTTVASPLLANVSFQYADGEVDTNSLTRTAFPVHMAGSELAVAGRLLPRPPARAESHDQRQQEVTVAQEQTANQQEVVQEGADNEALTARVDGDAVEDRFVSTPAVTRRLPPNSAPFMERLWAYLTVRQLLERGHGDDAEARQRAESLALRYSFVTPLTSLVAIAPAGGEARSALRTVKPGQQHAAPRSHGSWGPSAFSTFHLYAAPARPHNSALKLDRRMSAGRIIDRPSQRKTGLTHLDRGNVMSDFQQLLSQSGGQNTSSPGQNSSSSSQILLQKVPLSQIQWANNGVTGNGSHIVLPNIGDRQVYIIGEPQDGNATAPAACQVTLHNTVHSSICVPLPRCALLEFADSIDKYMPFFCAIGEYAGTCCIEQQNLQGS